MTAEVDWLDYEGDGIPDRCDLVIRGRSRGEVQKQIASLTNDVETLGGWAVFSGPVRQKEGYAAIGSIRITP